MPKVRERPDRRLGNDEDGDDMRHAPRETTHLSAVFGKY